MSAVFSAVKPVKITYSENPDFALIVTKTGFELDGSKLVWVKDKPVRSGDTLLEENVLTVKTYGYDDAAPADVNLQFTDGYTITATNATQTAAGVFTVDGSADVTLSVTRGTEPKTWLTAADTSWYDKNVAKASYTLTMSAQLAGLAVLVNGGVSFVNTTIILGNDISLKNNDGTSGTRLWRAIGSSAFKAFKGTFDGQGHTVRGLEGYSAGSYAGLFGCCTGAMIKNVTVRGEIASSASLSYAAGIVASASGCTIDNCRNYADISISDSNAAGIAAYITDGTTVSGCANSGSITASSGAGGIVGVSYTAADLIKNCENTGTVTATGGGTNGAAASPAS